MAPAAARIATSRPFVTHSDLMFTDLYPAFFAADGAGRPGPIITMRIGFRRPALVARLLPGPHGAVVVRSFDRLYRAAADSAARAFRASH